MSNQVIELASRPQGAPTENNFRIRGIEKPQPKEGEVLLKSLYISVDPYLRGRMSDKKSYLPPFQLDAPITSGMVAEIVESKAAGWESGDLLEGILPWKRFHTVDPSLFRKVDRGIDPPSLALSTIGMTGLTAYFGLLDIGQPKEGESVLVSAAAGAVGSIVVQIAKNRGCRVVGIAGSDKKIEYLKNELGVDAGINYKTSNDLSKSLSSVCPDGVDVYFDNVGGEVSDAVIPLINQYARIVLCGQISLYNATSAPQGPRVAPILVKKSALMKGFIVTDYRDRIKEGAMQLAGWYQQGLLQHRETLVEGFDQLPKTFLRLFSGDKIGKLVVKA